MIFLTIVRISADSIEFSEPVVVPVGATDGTITSGGSSSHPVFTASDVPASSVAITWSGDAPGAGDLIRASSVSATVVASGGPRGFVAQSLLATT